MGSASASSSTSRSASSRRAASGLSHLAAGKASLCAARARPSRPRDTAGGACRWRGGDTTHRPGSVRGAGTWVGRSPLAGCAGTSAAGGAGPRQQQRCWYVGRAGQRRWRQRHHVSRGHQQRQRQQQYGRHCWRCGGRPAGCCRQGGGCCLLCLFCDGPKVPVFRVLLLELLPNSLHMPFSLLLIPAALVSLAAYLRSRRRSSYVSV